MMVQINDELAAKQSVRTALAVALLIAALFVIPKQVSSFPGHVYVGIGLVGAALLSAGPVLLQIARVILWSFEKPGVRTSAGMTIDGDVEEVVPQRALGRRALLERR